MQKKNSKVNYLGMMIKQMTALSMGPSLQYYTRETDSKYFTMKTTMMMSLYGIDHYTREQHTDTEHYTREPQWWCHSL